MISKSCFLRQWWLRCEVWKTAVSRLFIILCVFHWKTRIWLVLLVLFIGKEMELGWKSHRLFCFPDSWCGHGSFVQSRAATANTTRGQSGSYHHYQYVHNLVSLASVTLGHATQGHFTQGYSTLGHTTLKSRYLVTSYHTGSPAI